MADIVPPERRACKRCGRIDKWDDEKETWVAAVAGGSKQRGRPHCLHEWDITGTYNPLSE